MGPSNYACYGVGWTPSATVIVQACIKVDSLPPSGKGIEWFTTWGAGGGYGGEAVGIINDSGTYKFIVRRVVTGGSSLENVLSGDIGAFVANKWY